MLIEAPCRLGEKFTHHRSYSNPKEQYLLGLTCLYGTAISTA